MNKLTKIGVSALCGPLASVPYANAGTLSVAGGATATWANNETETTGNPIGLSSGMTFTGTGELDNGTTFTLSLTNTDKAAYSAGNISIVTPGMGTFVIDQGAGGGGIDRYDDKMPTAWEETTGTGLSTGLRTVSGVGGVTDLEWNVGMGLPDGMNVYASFAPRPDGSANAKKGTAGVTSKTNGNGWDVVITHSGLLDGLNVFAGMSTIDQNATLGDKDSEVYGATYAIGGATVGYQHSKEDNVGASGTYYENDAYGISYSINDDLSVSYGFHESATNAASTGTLEATSIQVSYSVGGASIKFAENSVDNANYVSGTNREGRTIALTLAF